MIKIHLLAAILLILTACSPRPVFDAKAVHLSLAARIKGFDPIQANDIYSATQVSYVYEGLLEYHYLKRPSTLVPLLAEALPQISKDKTTYTFQLKKGVLFQDDPCFPGGKGRELLAEDFVYSWKRIADPKNTSSAWFALDGKVVGLNEWREAAIRSGKANYTASVEGLKTTSSHTFQVTLKKPHSIFLYLLPTMAASAVPHEAVEKYGLDFNQHAVGTGPYRLVENIPGSKIVWEKNPTYRRELYPSDGEAGDQEAGLLADAGQPLPRNERIITHIFEESLPMWLSFLSGQLDKSGIPKDNFAQALPNGVLSPELKAKGIRLFDLPATDLTRVSFNMADPLFGRNKLLRQALSLAYDTGPLIKNFYNGEAIPAQGPIPPALPGYDPAFQNPWRQFNLEKAKALLAKAGYPGGKGLAPIDYVAVAGSTSRQFTEYVERQFSQIGVHLKAEEFSWPEYVKRVGHKQGQMWGFGWQAIYPDAENFLELFYSKNEAPGPNDMNYKNPKLDRLYEQALLTLESKDRLPIYKKMVQLLVEDAPCIFGVHRNDHVLVQSRLRNVKLHPFILGQAKYWALENTK